ncbi:MAG: hypothetical protein ACREB2_11265 [Pseudolabrys sp.]
MVKFSALAFVLTIAAPLPALAYTQAEADACTPDAFRLCQQAIPDANRVADCLAQNRRQLSPACHAVFSRPAAASLTRERPARIERAEY